MQSSQRINTTQQLTDGRDSDAAPEKVIVIPTQELSKAKVILLHQWKPPSNMNTMSIVLTVKIADKHSIILKLNLGKYM